MTAAKIGSLIFFIVIASAFLGMYLGTVLPEDHLSEASDEAIKISIGLVSTMAALLLGLLIASAKSTYDAQQNRVVEMAAKITFLDRILDSYGNDTAEARRYLRLNLEQMLERVWPSDRSQVPELTPITNSGNILYDAIHSLTPENEMQTKARDLALETAAEAGRLFSLLFAQGGMTIPMTLLNIVVSWLVVIFLSFGLLAPHNGTVIAALIVSAIAVSTALFLVIELDRPFGGLIGVSSEPMRITRSQLVQND